MVQANVSFGFTGTNASLINDIDPNEIEDVEIVKGPSAATLYGTDAANGVVLITTKKGRSQTTRWNIYTENGILEDKNWYSDNYTLAGVSPTGAPLILSGQCTLVMVSAQTCLKTGGTKGYDSLRTFTPIKDKDLTPLGQGNRNAQGVQVVIKRQSMLTHGCIHNFFTRMSKRRMADIMHQGQRFD